MGYRPRASAEAPPLIAREDPCRPPSFELRRADLYPPITQAADQFRVRRTDRSPRHTPDFRTPRPRSGCSPTPSGSLELHNGPAIGRSHHRLRALTGGRLTSHTEVGGSLTSTSSARPWRPGNILGRRVPVIIVIVIIIMGATSSSSQTAATASLLAAAAAALGSRTRSIPG